VDASAAVLAGSEGRPTTGATADRPWDLADVGRRPRQPFRSIARSTRMRRILLALAVAALLAACGGTDEDTGGAQTTMDQGMDMSPSTQPPASEAARTIKLTANDRLRFQPATLSVKRGEMVAFTVTNTGKLAHEFVIGDQAFQDRHEKEMAGRTMLMADDADGIGLPAGATKTLTYTFREAGTLQYACHMAGHYQAGMKGTITVG
jgi:uncharacterized cupredoxin-like copper-binding protein